MTRRPAYWMPNQLLPERRAIYCSVLMAAQPLTRRVLLFEALCSTLLHSQELSTEQKQRVDAAIPQKAPAKPKQPRRMLVTNLSMRDGKTVRGSSYATLPVANYAIGQMGRRTGAFEAVFSDDVEMFRPEKIKQFDALCFSNTVGVLFEDPELKKSLLSFIAGGKALWASTMRSRPSCSIRSMTSGRPLARWLAPQRTGGIPGTAKS